MTITETVPGLRLPSERVEDISKQAREVRPGRVFASLIGGLLFLIGWLVAKAFGVAWFALVWCAIAVRQGWRDARGVPQAGPDLSRVLAENERLRAEIRRLQ